MLIIRSVKEKVKFYFRVVFTNPFEGFISEPSKSFQPIREKKSGVNYYFFFLIWLHRHESIDNVLNSGTIIQDSNAQKVFV